MPSIFDLLPRPLCLTPVWTLTTSVVRYKVLGRVFISACITSDAITRLPRRPRLLITYVGACITCRLCDKQFWAGNGFETHVKSQYPGHKAEWYKPETQLGELKLEPASRVEWFLVLFFIFHPFCSLSLFTTSLEQPWLTRFYSVSSEILTQGSWGLVNPNDT